MALTRVPVDLGLNHVRALTLVVTDAEAEVLHAMGYHVLQTHGEALEGLRLHPGAMGKTNEEIWSAARKLVRAAEGG